jgi:predicted RNA binding protein YcfA (HicA-like mRNA interferase family)
LARKLRVLSGKDVVAALAKFGFVGVSQRGSHAKLCRDISGERQFLIVPLHKELDRGMALALFRQASRYIPEDQLTPIFFVG